MNLIAHNVNRGGALVLLRELARRAEDRGTPLTAYIAPGALESDASSVSIRAGRLRDLIVPPTDGVALFFGNLPPMRRCRDAAVYVHNPYVALRLPELLSGIARGEIALKYLVIGLLFRLFSRNVDRVLVQTETMQRALARITRTPVELAPFWVERSRDGEIAACERTSDVCVIGFPSNHKRLGEWLEAVERLVDDELYPKVEMTLPDWPECAALRARLEQINDRAGRVVVVNNGHLDHEGVIEVYRRSKALVFPSLRESFGLPLVEAAECGLTIFAPKLPYVDDVVAGHRTIDPMSPRSMADAVGDWLRSGAPVDPPGLRVEDRGTWILDGGWSGESVAALEDQPA